MKKNTYKVKKVVSFLAIVLTLSLLIIPSGIAYAVVDFTVTDVKSTSATLNVSGLSTTNILFRVYAKDNNESKYDRSKVWFADSEGNGSYTFTGLIPELNYTAQVSSGDDQDTYDFNTPSLSFNVTDVKSTSATLNVSGLSTGDNIFFEVSTTSGTTSPYKKNKVEKADINGNGSYTFAGLKPEEKYTATLGLGEDPNFGFVDNYSFKTTLIFNTAPEKLTATNIRPTSVTLNAFDFSPNIEVKFSVLRKDSADGTPEYKKDETVLTNSNGNASSVFTGLSPGGNYVATIGSKNNQNIEYGVEYTISFSTPEAVLISNNIENGEECEIDEETNTCIKNGNTIYTSLAPLPDGSGQLKTEFETDPDINPCALGEYLNIIFRLVIGISAVLAMVMIIYGGIEYMSGGAISEKENGKNTIMNAVLGLLIALGAWLLLNTLNPQLLNVCLSLPEAKITIGGDDLGGPFAPIDRASLTSLGVYCPGTLASGSEESEFKKIAKSFDMVKVTYSQRPRNVIQSDILFSDCSSFVKQVYRCAGLDFNGDRTANMFPNAPYINSKSGNKVNGNDLQVGDLLGWINGESTEYAGGHVIMYIGDGQSIEVRNGSDPVVIRPWNTYGENLKHIIKIP